MAEAVLPVQEQPERIESIMSMTTSVEDLQKIINGLQNDISFVRSDASHQAQLAREATESLRDRFAIAAMNGLISSASKFEDLRDVIGQGAELSYAIADKMLAARKEKYAVDVDPLNPEGLVVTRLDK
jgi:cellulose biosynthesis protein BcsQ